MSCLSSRLTINIYERTKLSRLSANNGDHQRQTKRTGASKRFRRAADTDRGKEATKPRAATPAGNRRKVPYVVSYAP
jgi:hypothetical protein